jgi:hypothetical protein
MPSEHTSSHGRRPACPLSGLSWLVVDIGVGAQCVLSPSDALVEVVETFTDYFKALKWLNSGASAWVAQQIQNQKGAARGNGHCN